MGKKILAYYLTLVIFFSPLSSVVKEESSLDTLPLTTMLPKVVPQKLGKKSSLFNSYITFDDSIPLAEKKANAQSFPKAHLELISSFEPFSHIKEKNILKAPLESASLEENILIFLEGSFIKKILDHKTNRNCIASSKVESDQLEKNLDRLLSQLEENRSTAPLTPSLKKERFSSSSTPPYTEKKISLVPHIQNFKKIKTWAHKNLIHKKNALDQFAIPEEKKKETLPNFSITLKENATQNFHPHMEQNQIDLAAPYYIPSTRYYFSKLPSYFALIPNEYKPAAFTKRNTPNYLPKQSIFTKSNFDLPSIALEEKEQKPQILSIHSIKDRKITPPSFHYKAPAKYPFVQDEISFNLFPKAIAHNELFMQKNTTPYPLKELPTNIDLPISDATLLSKQHVHYPFYGRMKKTFYNHCFSSKKNAFLEKSHCIFSLDANEENFLSQLSNITIPKKTITLHKENNTFYAKGEEDTKQEIITLSFKRKLSKKSNNVSPFPIKNVEENYQENIPHLKLPKQTPKEEVLLAEKNYPELFEYLPTTIFFEKVNSDKPSKSFIANIETKETKYQNIASSKIHSNLTFTPKHSKRPFTASIKDNPYNEKILSKQGSITEEKAILTTSNSAKLPTKEYAIPNITSTDKKYIESQRPIQLDRIALHKHLPIPKTLIVNRVSLPNSSTSSLPANFYMESKLQLYTQNNDAVEEESRFVAIETNRSFRMTGYDLFHWPSLEDLQTDSLSENFSIETRLLQSELSDENEFACTIFSDSKDLLPSMPINILYIVDGSSRIEPHRFELFKKAVIDSLSYIDIHSTFNIAILHKGKIKKLRERNVHPTKSAKSFAKRFLRKMEQSKGPTFDEVISVLAKEKSLSKKGDIHRTCILLSDGNFAKNVRVNNKPLQKLQDIAIGNFSLFTATASDKNNKQMLSLLSKLNHGFSLFTRTHAAFPRKFSILVKKIKSPVLQDITISFPESEDTIAYLNDNIHPILHSGKNLTLFGASPKKSRQKIFIQGRAGNRWVNIVKELPLDTSRKGKYNLHKRLANQKTLFSIDSFLKSGDETHLSDAKKFSEEYDLHTLVP